VQGVRDRAEVFIVVKVGEVRTEIKRSCYRVGLRRREDGREGKTREKGINRTTQLEVPVRIKRTWNLEGYE